MQTHPKTEPVLMTLESAAQEGQLNTKYLLGLAGQGHDNLEVLVYVDFRDIINGVDVPITSTEPGCYLALPSYLFSRIIAKGDADVDSFLLPRHYDQPDSGAGLIMLQQIVSQSRDLTIKTRHQYHIRIDEDKLFVPQEQVQKYFRQKNSAAFIRNEIEGLVKKEINEALPSAKVGEKFTAGRQKGSDDPLTKLMIRIFKEQIEQDIKLSTKDLWEAIPIGNDKETGTTVQEKHTNESEDKNEWTIDWATPKGEKQKPLTFKSFEKRATKVRKELREEIEAYSHRQKNAKLAAKSLWNLSRNN